MEEGEDGDASTPFWLQSRRNNDTYFRRTSSLNSRATTVAIQAFFAGAAAILVVFFIIPPFLSSVSQFLRPHLVRKSWDYLNFVLVLFAVICGFLSRNTGDEESNHSKEEESKNNDVIKGYNIGDQFPDQTVYRRFSSLRSSSSYPDLRLREFESDERWRFYDDTRVSQCRYEALDPINRNLEDGGTDAEEAEVVATAEVELLEELTSPSNPPPLPSAPPYPFSPTPSPPPPPSKPAKRKTKRVYQNVAATAPPSSAQLYPPSAPPYPLFATPSPPPSPPRAPPPSKPAKRRTKRVYQDEEKKRADFEETTPITPAMVYQESSREEKKKGGATKDFLVALRRKKKKQRQQSIDGLDLLFGSDPQFDYTYTPPHPPPPPPPPPLFFQGLSSSKKGKSKRTNPTPPPPPPAPPPYWSFESRASMANIHKAHTSKTNPEAEVSQFIGTGSESPLLPIPPPPPPPPFKMPAWKFVKRGDYVRMASNISISSDEPDDDPGEAQSSKTVGSMFCPSPDVDTKADDFIARFRAGLKLEKMNSVKRGRSNLGPES